MMTETTWRNQLSENERIKLVKKASDCIWTPAGKVALDYLINERGLSETAIKQFQIGFVPLSVNHQTRGRLIHPIYDATNNLIAVSTRHLSKPKAEAFWHEDFEKRFYLLGLNIAKEAILRENKALVVEGELDVEYYHSHGVPITVGLMGSSLSIFQVAVLSRYCKRIFLLFDADKGGKKAFEQCKSLYEENLVGRVELVPCRMPSGLDPDEFLKPGGAAEVGNLMKTEYEQFKELGYF